MRSPHGKPPRSSASIKAGLYVNYVFTYVWLADVTWWWAAAASYRRRPRWVEWTVHGFMGFIAFNATVVFASGFSRWFGIAACVLLASVWGQRILYPRDASH